MLISSENKISQYSSENHVEGLLFTRQMRGTDDSSGAFTRSSATQIS